MARQLVSVNFISPRQKRLPRRTGQWFNYMVMPKWFKPVLFGFGLTVAVVIATNPNFILPYKYHFAVPPPVLAPIAEPIELASVTQLPNGLSAEPAEPVEEVVEPVEPAVMANKVEVAAAAKTEPGVWLGGSLKISSLAIAAPLVYVGERAEKTFQTGLRQGVVQYPGTALPGQLGNMYVFGHSSDYRWSKGSYKTIFAKLPNIKVGSEIKVTDTAGKVYTYKVVNIAIALPTEVKYLSQYNYQRKLLTVQTSYPVGTALKRFVAIAELIE